MTVKVADHTTFFEKLNEFLRYLVQFHPGQGGPEKALSFLAAFRGLPETHERMSSAWFNFTRPIEDAIRKGDATTVATAFDGAENTIIRNIEAGNILLADEPDELAWEHLRALTLISEGLHQAAAKPQQPAAKPQQPQQPNEVIKNIASAIPEIFKGLNDALKQDDGNNPLATIFKQLTSNGPAQESTSLPIDAGATEILNRTGLSAEEVVQKLKRLSVLEKYYERRKGKSQE